MILKVSLIGIMFLIIVIIAMFGFLINEIHKGRYEVDNSILEKEAEGKYEVLYPKNSINDLKDEIEKIAELLIAGEETNRYTELLRRKAENDERMHEISNAVTEKVELVKYVNDVLKARIKYKDYENEYTLILSFSTVTGGRVFLNDYFVFKNKIEIANAS